MPRGAAHLQARLAQRGGKLCKQRHKIPSIIIVIVVGLASGIGLFEGY
jgi:hypothetical protein